MKHVLLAGIGGFIGSAARYAVGVALHSRSIVVWFPLATLSVNVVGSFLIGFLATHGAARGWMDDASRAFIIAGLLGGFTTFSAFSYETMSLWRDVGPGRATLNIALNLTLCLIAVWLGHAFARSAT